MQVLARYRPKHCKPSKEHGVVKNIYIIILLKKFLKKSEPSSKASGHKRIAYLAPSIWNELPSDMKLIPNLNTFKHKLKKWFLENLKKEEQNIYTN